METVEHILEFKFDKKPHNRTEFIKDCEGRIYRSIYKVFEELYISGKKRGRLVVHALICGKKSDKIFNVSTSATSLLRNDILEHFSNNEEFEKCTKILTMCEEFQ